MLDAQGYPGRMRILRALLLFKLGFWAGIIASGVLLKRVLPSRGDADSDEVALVASLGGVELKSRAKAFRGGSMFSWIGGIAVDLREAQLAPNAQLDVRTVFGGIAIRVPPGWRIESDVKSLGGGVAIGAPVPEANDAPTLKLDGFTVFGGVAVGAKPADGEF
jgi:Cell wall-active antibiotics response 4TMS YvqF